MTQIRKYLRLEMHWNDTGGPLISNNFIWRKTYKWSLAWRGIVSKCIRKLCNMIWERGRKRMEGEGKRKKNKRDGKREWEGSLALDADHGGLWCPKVPHSVARCPFLRWLLPATPSPCPNRRGGSQFICKWGASGATKGLQRLWVLRKGGTGPQSP